MAKRTIPIQDMDEGKTAADAQAEVPPSVEPASGQDDAESVDEEAAASPAPEAEPVEEAAQESEPPPPPPDPTLPFVAEIQRLKRALDEKDRTLQKYIAAYKKAEGEFKRSTERLEQDVERRIGVAEGELTARFFGVLDDLERSLESGRKTGDAAALLTGIEMVYKTFLARLEDLGVERYESTGAPFDPGLHEAMGVVPVSDPEANNRVAQVYQAGYRRKGQVLRPARVLVGKMA